MKIIKNKEEIWMCSAKQQKIVFILSFNESVIFLLLPIEPVGVRVWVRALIRARVFEYRNLLISQLLILSHSYLIF